MRRGGSPPEGLPLIDDDLDPSATRVVERVATGRHRRLWPSVVVAAVALLAWGLTNAGDEMPLPDATPLAPEGNDSADLATPAQLSELLDGEQIVAVVSSRSGDERQLMTITADTTELVDLPELSSFVFDRSGQWLAAVSVSRRPTQRNLWVAPVGGTFEPIATDVRGFAWHDTAPGQIAWSTEARTDAFTLDVEARLLDLDSLDPNRIEPNRIEPNRIELPEEGIVRGWGDWGMAIQTSLRTPASALLDPDGAPQRLDVPGVYSGTWHDGRLIFSGGESAPVFITIDDWRIDAVPWLTDDDFVWTLSSTADQSVALIAMGGLRRAPFEGVVVRSDGDEVAGAADASAYTRVAWLDDGTVFAEQSIRATDERDAATSLTVLTNDGDRIALAFPPSLDGDVWVNSIAVPQN